MNNEDQSYQVNHLLNRLNEETVSVNDLEAEITLLQEEYTSFENRKAVVLAKLLESMEDPFLDIQVLFGWIPATDYVESFLSIARAKRRLDHAWCEYYDAVHLYESTRSQILDISKSTPHDISQHIAFRSNSLPKILQDRDFLYAKHKNLLTDFLLLKAKHDRMSRKINASLLRRIEPHIRILESIDELSERNRTATENKQLKLTFSKAAYQGVLLRLDEISGAIHDTLKR